MSNARLVLVSALAGLAGCGEGPQGPGGPGPTVRVSVAALGIDHPAPGDGYLVHAGQESAYLAPGGSAAFTLPPGPYDVRLDGVPPNCSLDGDSVVRVVVPPSFTGSPPAIVTFTVTCQAVSGNIEVLVSRSGRDFPFGAYPVTVDGLEGIRHAQAVANVLSTLEGFPPGPYILKLGTLGAGEGDNCQSTGPDEVTVTIPPGGLTRYIARAGFQITCAAITGDLRVSATTTGQSLDKNGYTVSLDGEPIYEPYEGPLRLRVPSGSYLVKRLSPGSHTVELRDISSNCTISGANPRTVSVVVGVATEVVFNVACTSSP